MIEWLYLADHFRSILSHLNSAFLLSISIINELKHLLPLKQFFLNKQFNIQYSFLLYDGVVLSSGSFPIYSFSSKFIIASFDIHNTRIKTSFTIKTIIIKSFILNKQLYIKYSFLLYH